MNWDAEKERKVKQDQGTASQIRETNLRPKQQNRIFGSL